MRIFTILIAAATALSGALALTSACSTPDGPSTGTQTNWLRICAEDTDCGVGDQCLCNTCTRDASQDASVCDDLPGATPVASTHSGAIALCDGIQPEADSLCLALCGNASCPKGTRCVADVCAPNRQSSLTVSIDTTNRYQSLYGFGASISYIEGDIAEHPDTPALYDAMFAESGFEVIRLRNLYIAGEVTDFSATSEILDAAIARMSSPPTLFLTSGSPPPILKQNSSTYCEGNPDTCTLTRAENGGFDYEGLAEHLRGSLEEYANAGISLDFFSIQNDPNFVPPAGQAIETCYFLPREGFSTVLVDGEYVNVEFPGYSEAMSVFVEAISDLPIKPKLAGPEATGVRSSVDFVQQLDLTNLDAVAHHMYGIDPLAPDNDAMTDLRAFGQTPDRPLLQTEMAGDGLQTALLVQQGLIDIGTSMYLQTTFIAPATLSAPDTGALISLTETGFELQDPYHALRHFSHDTERGWVRVDANVSKSDSLRVSAWLSPEETELTIILVNPLTTDEVVTLGIDVEFGAGGMSRTVFTGDERSADLGILMPDDSFVLPGSAIATVSFSK